MLLEWHSNNKFCSRCGSPTKLIEGGDKRQCLQKRFTSYSSPSLTSIVSRSVLSCSGQSSPSPSSSSCASCTPPATTTIRSFVSGKQMYSPSSSTTLGCACAFRSVHATASDMTTSSQLAYACACLTGDGKVHSGDQLESSDHEDTVTAALSYTELPTLPSISSSASHTSNESAGDLPGYSSITFLPRSEPTVLVMVCVIHPQGDRVLLTRSATCPHAPFSCFNTTVQTGFSCFMTTVQTGMHARESWEQAARRSMQESGDGGGGVAIDVDRLSFQLSLHQSHSSSFGGQQILLVGFHAYMHRNVRSVHDQVFSSARTYEHVNVSSTYRTGLTRATPAEEAEAVLSYSPHPCERKETRWFTLSGTLLPHTHTQSCTHTHTRTHTHTHIHTHTHAHTHIHTHTHTHARTHTYTHTHTRTYTHTRTRTHEQTHTHTYIYTHITH